MLIYVVCFMISVFFAFRADSSFKDNNKKNGIVYSLISILVLTLLASFRGISVGKDTGGYIVQVFKNAIESESFTKYWNTANYVETGYRLLCYIISRFTTQIGYLFFVSELLVILPIYLSFYMIRNKVSLGYGMLCFCFLFYSNSLSMIRQAIAIAFLIYSFVCMINNKNSKAIIFFILAVLFHNSSAAFILILILYKFLNLFDEKKIDKKFKVFLLALFIGIMLIFIAFYESLILFLVNNFNIISTKYLNYFYSNLNLKERNFLLFDSVYSVIWIYLILVYIIKTNEKNEDLLLLDMLLIDFATIIISSKMSLFFRFGMLFGMPAKLLIIPQIEKLVKKDLVNRILIGIILFTLLGCYWCYSEIIRNNYGIYPYVINWNNF